MPRSIIRTVTIAIAIAALAAPAAFARPAEMPPAVAKAAAAEQHKQARLAQINPYPTRPAQGEQANPRPEPTVTTASVAPVERDIAWTTIAFAIAGGMLALAAIAGIVRHTRRSERARITA
jgi:hypothetical protein